MALLAKRQLESLVRQAQTGDDQAFSELYRSTVRAQYITACSILKDYALAEDAVQSAYLRAYRKLPKLSEPGSFIAWMSKITYNCCITLVSREGKMLTNPEEDSLLHIPDEGPDTNPLKHVIERERRSAVMDKLMLLSLEHRTVLLLRYYQNLKMKEIAQITGCSEGTVKSRIHYGLKQLKKELISQGYCGSESLWGMGIYISGALRSCGGMPFAPLSPSDNKREIVKTAGLLTVMGSALILSALVFHRAETVVQNEGAVRDTRPPYIQSYNREQHLLKLYVRDEDSGVDYAVINADTADGVPIKVRHIDQKTGEIMLPFYEKDGLVLKIADMAGNKEVFEIAPADRLYKISRK